MEIDVKEYLDSQIENLRREFRSQLQNDWRALDLARENMTLRLEGMNQFREQMNRERDSYVRVDTFRWIVVTLLSIVGILAVRAWK